MSSSPIVAALRLLSDATRRGVYRDAPVYDGPTENRETPFQSLVGCVISQRVRDQQTGIICRRLFELAPTPETILALSVKQLERQLYGAGFFRQKAQRIRDIARIVSNSGVPTTREGMLGLPGIGPKCANLVLATQFGEALIAVDTHVHRISNRLGWVVTTTPDKTELMLTPRVPKRWRRRVNVLLVAHGQMVCRPISPKCDSCRLLDHCDRRGVEVAPSRRRTPGRRK